VCVKISMVCCVDLCVGVCSCGCVFLYELLSMCIDACVGLDCMLLFVYMLMCVRVDRVCLLFVLVCKKVTS